MASFTTSNDAFEVQKQLKNRSQIEEYLNKIDAMVRVATMASTHEFFNAQMTQDYFCTIHQLLSDAKKINQEELDILLTAEALLKEDDTANSTETEPKTKPRFNSREAECIRKLLKGKAAAEVGGDLNISERTVEFYVFSVVRKLAILLGLKLD